MSKFFAKQYHCICTTEACKSTSELCMLQTEGWYQRPLYCILYACNRVSSGRVKAADDVDYKGEIEIPNLSEEHSPEEVDINVSLDDKHSEGMQVKEYIRTKGVKIIREQLKKYTKDLREGSLPFILDISIAPLKSSTTRRCSRLQYWYCIGVNTPKRYRQLWMKDLPKVPTWRLEWDSNLRLSGHNGPNLPLSHHE